MRNSQSRAMSTLNISLDALEPRVLLAGDYSCAADAILHADDLRTAIEAMGGGATVKIGVISNGIYDYLDSVNSGDLPASIAVPAPYTLSQYASLHSYNEGAAMLEIVHDIAPSADLLFEAVTPDFTGDLGPPLADAVNWMVEQGVNIIVDDVFCHDLSFFVNNWPGLNDAPTAIRHAIADHNVTYVTAAGNAAQSSYVGQADLDLNNYQQWPDPEYYFDGTKDIPLMPFTVGSVGALMDIQWSDLPALSDDYAMELYKKVNGVWQWQSTAPSVWGEPRITQPIQSAGEYGIALQRVDGNDDSLTLHVFGAGAIEFDPDYPDPEDKLNVTSWGSIVEHATIGEVITVGAIDADDPYELWDTPEPFSSYGESITDVDPDNDSDGLQEVTYSHPLDLMGIDNIETKVGSDEVNHQFPSHFYGTSAAAPSVAAVAALLLSYDPSVTPAEIHSFLTNSAVYLGSSGNYDDQTGYGRVDAYAAWTNNLATAPSGLHLKAVSDTGASSSDLLTNRNNTAGKTLQFDVDGTVSGVTVTLYTDGNHVIGTGIGNGGTITITTNETYPLTEGGGFNFEMPH